jgi:hypothetical protein
LYEERLSTAEARRYEMEDLIGSLREQLRSQAQSPSPTSAARQLSSATQIENEALREQVVHLQKKLTITEDMLEEVHATAERDEAMVRDKIRRFKEKEDLLKQQVAECESEIARIVKSENNARIRTEEVGEALRESTVALENARAEIEGLRAEIVVRKYIIPESMIIDASQDLEGVAGLSSTDSVDGTSEPTPRSTHGHMHYIEEIARLKGQLAEATEALQGADDDRISASSSQLQKTIDELVIEKTNVRYSCAPVPAQLRVFFSLRTFRVTYTPGSLKRRMLPPTCVSASSVLRRSLRPCARRLIVMHPSLTVFSRLVNSRRLPPGTTLFLALFAKRWPDLSESSLNLSFLITDDHSSKAHHSGAAERNR